MLVWYWIPSILKHCCFFLNQNGIRTIDLLKGLFMFTICVVYISKTGRVLYVAIGNANIWLKQHLSQLNSSFDILTSSPFFTYRSMRYFNFFSCVANYSLIGFQSKAKLVFLFSNGLYIYILQTKSDILFL